MNKSDSKKLTLRKIDILVISLAVALFFVTALCLIFVNKPQNVESDIAKKQIIPDDVRYDIPGVYYASAGLQTGASEAPMSEKAGMVYVGSGSSQTMNGGAFRSHAATYGGAVYVADGGTFTMNGGVIAYNQAKWGGAIYVEAGGTCILNGGTITGNASEEATAVYVEDGGNLIVDGCNIVNNYTQLYGNYIDVYVDGTLNRSVSLGLNNTTFNLSQAPLNYENCCGYFTDEAMTKPIEDGESLAPVVQSAIATGMPGKIFNIYTKPATDASKLAFTYSEGLYIVKQSNTSNRPSGELVIPRQYNDGTNGLHDVAEIYNGSFSNGAFSNNRNITAVYMPNTITSIGSSAFNGCSGLTEITIPNGVTSIGSFAFYYCTGLTEIKYNANITTDFASSSYIFNSAGMKSRGINLIIGEDVTYFPRNLLMTSDSDRTNIVSVTVGSNVTGIGDYAFGAFPLIEVCNLSSLDITAGSSSNGNIAGRAKAVVTREEDKGNFTESNGVYYYVNNKVSPSVGKTAVGWSDRSVTDIVLDSDCVAIHDYAFNFYKDITSITFPEGMTSIGRYVFNACQGLTSITIPSTLTSIGSQAFFNCHYLVEVINKSPLNIQIGSESNGYVGYYASVVLTNEEDKGDFITSNGVVYYINTNVEDMVKSAMWPVDKNATTITIDNDCTTIQHSAFKGRSELTRIIIPNSVTSIGIQAFYSCRGLTSITIPNSVTSIGSTAFSGCTGLTSITIPNSVTSIGGETFCNCTGLTSITIPASVTGIEGYAFQNCTNLATVTIDSATVAGWASNNINAAYCKLLDNANVVYVKDSIATADVGTWITGSFTYQETTGGYHRYTKNS